MNTLKLVLLALFFSGKLLGGTGGHLWLSEETCRQSNSGGEDYVSENYKNGGAPFYTDPLKRSHLIEQLNFFNDTFDTDLRVYCGRFFLNYDATWNWDTSLYSMFSPALRTAYNNYTAENEGPRTGQSAIQVFYPSYRQYVERPGANMLLVYLECHYYVNFDTNNVVSTMSVIGLISRGITGDNILRVQYLKSDAVVNEIRTVESPQDRINAYVDKIVTEFSTPVLILNPHCPDCPLHPSVGTDYWDDDGRLWRWMEGADHTLKWMDLSYEFPEEGQGYDLSWKPQIPDAVQLYHRELYTDKIALLRNDPLQHSLGGVPPALEKELWRVTQFAAVNTLKERHINQNVSIWESFIPVWGNAKSAYYNFQVANGQLAFQVAGCIGIAMTAMDIILCEGFIQNGMMGALRSPVNFATKGFSFIRSTGARIIVYGQQSTVKLSLILALRKAPQASLDFFTNRGLPRAMEIFDQSAQKYIKYNPDDGKALVGQYVENLDGTSSLVFERELTIPNTAGTNEQSIADNIITKLDEFIEKYATLIDNSVTEVQRAPLPNEVASSFKDGVYRTVLTNENITVFRNFGGSAKLKGSYTTTINNAVREELALVPDFNNTMRFRSRINVPSGQQLNIGKVGPWPPNNPLMQGGADQILLPQNYPDNWISEIIDTHTGQVYTFEQFTTAFPGQ